MKIVWTILYSVAAIGFVMNAFVTLPMISDALGLNVAIVTGCALAIATISAVDRLLERWS